jgi:hypothetical protein
MTKRPRQNHLAVVVRARDVKPEDAIPGSKPDVTCDICSEKCWRSPATRRRRQLTGYRCKQCAADTFDGTEIGAPLTEDQIAEVLAALRRRNA